MQVSGAISDVLVALPSTGCYRAPEFKNYFHPFPDSKNSFLHASATSNKSLSSLYVGKLATGLDKSKTRGYMVRASENSGENNNMAPIAPVHMESPVGQLLAQMLQTHPHLVPAAIDQQLENLQFDREVQERETSSSTLDVLYRRIAELRERERRTILEDLIYCSIVHRFVKNIVTMIPKLSPGSDRTGRVDYWPNQEKKLESVHSPEAFYMIQSHLSDVLGDRLTHPSQSLVESSNIRLGKLYAASTIYGYFLRRVDRRYQLEITMKTLPKEFGKSMNHYPYPTLESPWWDPDSLVQIPADADTASFEPVDASDDESSQLKSYVKYLDPDTLQRYATIRSKEALSLIEKQTQALFGQPGIKTTEGFILESYNEERLYISVAGAKMLVLEAVTFGSFLWDAEDHAESKYSFVSS